MKNNEIVELMKKLDKSQFDCIKETMKTMIENKKVAD